MATIESIVSSACVVCIGTLQNLQRKEANMGRRRANILANQIRDQFVNAPQEIRIDFLRKNDEVCESEANDFLQTLASFQREFGQLTSVFDTNANNWNSSGKINETTQESEAENHDLGLALKEMLKSYSTAKVVVNPEISQKVQAAESAALAKYMEQMQLQNQIAQNNAAMKSYARPATPSTARGSTVIKAPLSALSRKTYSIKRDNTLIDETDAEMAAEIKEMKEEIMDRFNNQDRLIECGRERLKQKLQERRMAAMAAKGNVELARAQAILSRQEMVENNVDKTKVDMQRKLRSRIEEKMHNRGKSAPVVDEEIGVEIILEEKEEIAADIEEADEEIGGDIGAAEEEIGEEFTADEGEMEDAELN